MRDELTEMLRRIEVTGFCWLWRGSIGTDGYGITYFMYTKKRAHRRLYSLLVEPVPDELDIEQRIAHGHRYGNDRTMRVAGINTGRWQDDARRELTGFIGPMPAPTIRWWLVDPDRPRDESLMSWVESDWCELERIPEDGALW